MRVNVISIFYWPEQTGIAPYATGAAEYLAKNGDEVTAVVGVPHFPAWKKDRTLRTPSSETRGGVRVLRFSHHIPSRHNALQRAMYELSFFLSVAGSTRFPRADVSVAIVPNLAAAYIALARRHTAGPYGVIVQDVSSRAAAQSGIAGGRLASGMASRIEGPALRRAAFVGLVSTAFTSSMAQMRVDPERVITVPNWTHVAAKGRNRSEVREMFGWRPDSTVALHAGNMGRKQALETIIDSARAADATGAPVEFVLMGDGNQRTRLEDYAQGVSRLHFLAPQPDDLFGDVLTAADMLLLSERSSVRDMSLPSKLTSYFAAGRPVVGSIPFDGASAAELARAGAGVVVPAADPAALLSAVMDLRRNPAMARSLGNAGRVYADSCLQPERTLQELRSAIHAVGRGPSRDAASRAPFGTPDARLRT